MAGRSVRPRLQDILDHIAIVNGAIAGRDLASFASDPVLRLAIERAIEIISEAVRHIPQEQCDKHPDMPWRNIMAIGNKLRHEYQRVDPDIIWEIAHKHLGELQPVIEAIRADLP
ncbi:MAG: DUF86 domain-containing protein [Hyphomonadaceae bacterium]|jgi:uncharacterized protein with HEPN domain|nr:DUF86 domain-containing protein [Hyphomonadaceae bacterium]